MMMSSTPRPTPTLWSDRGLGTNRRVTWLELFFDLVFVAAVAEVGSPLSVDYSMHGLARYSFMLLLIWWAWHGFALYVTRFDASDWVQRVLTFAQMVTVIFMAANAEDDLHSASSAGFAAAYALMRLMLAAQYVRVVDVPSARALARESAIGIAIAAAAWLGSAFTEPPARYGLWALAMAIEVATAVRASRHTQTLPPDPAHLPERFGLFTLILLGESIVAVMKGIQAQPEWSVLAASSALLGIGLVFGVWQAYFEAAGAATERHVLSHRDARAFAVWHYAHLPLYLGLVLASVGFEHIIKVGGRLPLEHEAPGILIGALAVLALALVALHRCASDRPATKARALEA